MISGTLMNLDVQLHRERKELKWKMMLKFWNKLRDLTLVFREVNHPKFSLI